MPEKQSALVRQNVAAGCEPRLVKAPNSDLIADLTRIADGFRWTASRVGNPGCLVRRKAAEDEATIRAAIELIRHKQRVEAA